MTASRPRVLLVCSRWARDSYMWAEDLERLDRFADLEWLQSEGNEQSGTVDPDKATRQLLNGVGDVNAIVVSSGAPKIDATVMGAAPELQFIGDLAGDRFAKQLDFDAAQERGIRIVDTSNGPSYPVAEWALALILVSLRNAGAHFRRMIAGEYDDTRHYSHGSQDDPGFLRGDLTGKRVGLIGCGHIGRRLIKYMAPFEVDVRVYDPYLPREMADAVGFLQTSLDYVMSQADAIVCLVPLTPRTRGMIGWRELDLIPSGAVLVNVSRGAVIDSEALIERLKRGDIVAGLDVFDPDDRQRCAPSRRSRGPCRAGRRRWAWLPPNLRGRRAAGRRGALWRRRFCPRLHVALPADARRIRCRPACGAWRPSHGTCGDFHGLRHGKIVNLPSDGGLVLGDGVYRHVSAGDRR